ncbi:kinesin-related protein 4-like isoform X1 [Maniola jurtina]|uniref:kinesin-related protein 4-like isoform X1 n=1 Tax=Maniola jurtina TaxID=191418 RepID=UPI001E68C28C|nr:kinesin-related protein 4-like isoform X1 [Maniola jurtina]
MSDNIKVVVKVRPLIRREIEDKLLLQWRVVNNALVQIDQNGRESGPYFTFDKVYDERSKTSDVYNDIAKPIVEAATAGFNGTIFAYGQTSSGKTYTMTGTDESPGIIQLAVINLFDIIKNVPDRDFLVRVSYVEIYNETLTDLLNIEKRVKIHDTFQGVRVDATEEVTTSPEEVLEVMRKGKANRQTGATNMNDESSRSHSIFQITIESREHIEGEEEVGSVNVSQLNLVDLAGSERAGQTGATGLRFKEGTHINKSLSVLALVIKQLSEDRNKHANYRDSKLTRILQNSLGGNAKTSIICAVTPAALEETISTLQFANRAKSVKNTPAVNAVATDATMIQSLTKQLSSLKTQLESKKNVEKVNFDLQKHIERLQRLILNGFGQRSNTDMLSGARRKLQQPRRVTISTLHPIQEDPAPPVPRFCTPSLKYNPMSLNTLPEFTPIQSSSSLTSVAEEPRLITPPPNNRKVTISDEIIELDSDDDNSTDVQTCSPYHGCFQSSKTPPCILRKNAKLAEKNLKDIVELTEREKLYTPNVVELMENLEKKSLRIANLEEKLIQLDDLSKEKDKEMERLKSKISEAEQQIKDIASAKTTLEIACKEYATKLTDWEVSYETLQKKAKTREEELLSLLQEHETRKKNEKIGKISSKALGKELVHFMDLSRDISLVNSDNENSIIKIEEMHLNPVLRTNNDLETKLRVKDQTIIQLEANLHAQLLKMDSLENTNKQFQEMISDFKDKISVLENENTSQLLKIGHLNQTIESQKSANEKAMADIESYGNIIKELKIKLSNKEDTTMTYVSDSDLETMISNEELFIANNENMKNIIQTFKTALYSRNEEIKKLQSTLDKESTHDFKTLEEELECKKREISLLVKEIESLKEDHIQEVNNFILTKNNLLSVEQQMKTQLLELRETKDKETEAHLVEIANLTKCKEDLTAELMKKEHDNETLQTEINKLTREVCTLKNDNRTKDNIIAELRKKEKVSHENLARVTSQLRNIIVLLSGKILEVPQMIDNLVSAFGTLTDNLTSLEAIAKEIIKEKNDLRVLVEHHQKTFNKIKLQIDDLDNCVDDFYNDGECLSSIIHKNNGTKRNLQDDSHQNIELEMSKLMDKIKTTLECLNKNARSKDIEINNIKAKFESQLTSENAKHLQQIQKIAERRKELLVDLLQKANDVALQFNTQTSSSIQIESDVEDTLYEQIILTFDNIANNISILKSERATESDSIQENLSKAKNEILKLTEENRKMLLDISNLEKNNADLSAEIKNIQSQSKILKVDLKESNTIINELRNDLVSKTNEIGIIENKTKEWKDKFREHEPLIKEQIRMLELENIELKTKCSELEMQYRQCGPTPKSNLASGNQKCVSIQSLDSPPSLLTICCNRIIESIHHNENDNLESSSSTSTDLKNICQCAELTADLNMLQEENCILKSRIKELENRNDYLVKEQNEAQKEVQLLVESTQELQKKVVNHRTNLSTLTATTYAENKSLTSQIKFLQHHHNRFHNVCQKDIPALKNQLKTLMTLLKSENIYRQNESLKRYSLPNALDITPTHSKFKNESISDCDLLMLDTNITLTTCDNTLVDHDQTCLDVTQICTYNEVACQTSFNEITNYDLLHSQMDIKPFDCKKILDTLESLKAENNKLRDLVDGYSKSKKSNANLTEKVCSPIKISSSSNETGLLSNNNEPIDLSCNCNHEENIRIMVDTHKKEITTMTNKLNELQSQKQDIELKYRDLTLEVPSTELLVQKLNAIEKEHSIKLSEITKISQNLVHKNEKIRHLQEENDILSNQVMETISELDDLKKEHDSLKEMNSVLMENCAILGIKIEDSKHKDEKKITCTECKLKNEVITSLKNKLASESHIKLDRSYSDSDSSSRCNKICSLQNELHAGKEDCIELKEEVTTIKNHLDRSNITINHVLDLDDNIENSHAYCYNDFENINSQVIECDMPNIAGESLGIFALDKENCLNYYAEKTGANKESLASDVKLIDIMKMLYEYIEIKHANEVENLVNKLKDFEESKKALQTTLHDIKTENLRVTKELEEKNSYFATMANVVSHVRNNITVMRDAHNHQDSLIHFKDNFLKVIDKEFGLSSTVVFDIVIQQLHQTHTSEMESLRNDNTKLEDDIQQIVKNLQNVNESCTILKSQLNEKENEFNLLQRQKEEVHNINAAVTLDIVKIEKELRNQVISGYRELVEKNILHDEIDLSLPTNKLIELLFELTLNKMCHNELMLKEKNNIAAEVDKLKSLIDIKDAELRALTSELSKLQEINTNIQLHLTKTEGELNIQKSQLEHLNTIHLKKVEENDVNTRLIDQLTKEVNELKATLLKKQALVTSLEAKLETYNENHHLENQLKISQLMKSITDLEKETENLKSINELIAKEKDNYSMELEKAAAVIKQNKIDLDEMKETVKENLTVADNLRREFEALKQTKDTLAVTNKQLQEQIQEKCQNCSRLEVNIRTHEKTAEIQSRMIKRLQKQKEEDDKLTCEKDLKLDELTRKCKSLESEYEKLMNDMKSSRDEIVMLRNGKLLLEARITDLEEEVQSSKRRPSLEVTETVRRRRQSIHDSKRMFSEDNEDQTALKSHSISEDVFMDVDANSSNRSTPVFMQKGRDSLLSKHDQSEREEEQARCHSVQAHRRRRQSVHDLHRSVRLTPDTNENSRESSRNNSFDSEVTQLKKQLSACHKELEELKEKYRELDEECETCAEYLRERDEQCLKLKREKRELESTIAELKEKLTNVNPNSSSKANSFADASVNTDEDWANLHAVVVDRMSYDAEVEKNKKLVRTIEELRYHKQDLRANVDRLQKALDMYSSKDKELEAMQVSLSACTHELEELRKRSQELEELRQRVKELDDECETCADYLRERDEQCRKLREANKALEAKLLEHGDTAAALRLRRQALHDQRRTPAPLASDAATNTSDDLLTYQVERDNSKLATDDKQAMELNRLKMALEKVSQQKTELEQQLAAAPRYVATGSAIVQNQQITDVIKENQKLKKMNAKLVTICKKRGKALTDNRENEQPSEQFN